MLSTALDFTLKKSVLLLKHSKNVPESLSKRIELWKFIKKVQRISLVVVMIDGYSQFYYNIK